MSGTGASDSSSHSGPINFDDLHLWESMVEHLDDGLCVIDGNQQITYWNSWMVRTTGISREDALQQTLDSIFNGYSGSRIEDSVVRAVDSNLPAVLSNIFNRTPFPLYHSHIPDVSDTMDVERIQQHIDIIPLTQINTPLPDRQFLVHIRDVSASVNREKRLEAQVQERKRAEVSLDQERALFISGPTVVIKKSLETGWPIEYISANSESVLGYSNDRLCGDDKLIDYRQLIHPEDVLRIVDEINELLISDTSTFEQEYRLRLADGSYRWFYDLTRIVRDKKDNAYAMHGYILDITDRKEIESRVEHLAYHDTLTGLANRRHLMNQLEQEISRAQRHNYYGALLFIDLDRFKLINDTYGHQIGDELLIAVSQRLVDSIRTEDQAIRMGGDEFVVLLTHLGESRAEVIERARIVAEKVQSEIAAPYLLSGNEVINTPSIGVEIFPIQDDSAEKVLQRSDIAMYEVKKSGRFGIHFYDDELMEESDRLRHFEVDLNRALENGELELHYQPQINVKGHLAGTEVLLRWNHPTRGMVSPVEFIPVAEENGQIIPIGHWVLNQACRQFCEWQQDGYSNLPDYIAVNVSPKQFHHETFVDDVRKILEQTGFNPKHLDLELTEGVVISDVEDAIRKMDELKLLGVRISLDDFGTGYSSLGYLKRLPVDVLKIDRSFVNDITKSKQDEAIVDTIISMSQHMGMGVIAEGVEEHGEKVLLESKGCHMFQGFLFSKPLDQQSFIEWMKQHNLQPEIAE